MSPVNFKEDYHKIRFQCAKCGNCCRNSRIRLSPYDISRICKRLSISIGEFHQKYTFFINDSENQNFPTCLLKTKPECVFLGLQGCRIYEDRPLGCRTFPLAIQPLYDGEKFKTGVYILEQCPGFNSGKKITIGEFKQQQGIDLGEKYQSWIKFVVKALNTQLPTTSIYYDENLRY